jgi:ribosomal protein L7/L12
MKIQLDQEELKVLTDSHQKLVDDVVRLTAELMRLEERSSHTNHRVEEMVSGSQMTNALANVCAALANGNKIAAIKLVREFTRLGLKEAKDVVEGTYSGPGVTRVA